MEHNPVISLFLKNPVISFVYLSRRRLKNKRHHPSSKDANNGTKVTLPTFHVLIFPFKIKKSRTQYKRISYFNLLQTLSFVNGVYQQRLYNLKLYRKE